jgi:hypothetical protein
MEKIDKLFTTEQAAKELHISPRTLNNARSTGTGIVIPYHKIGSRVFYKQSDIEAYIENIHSHRRSQRVVRYCSFFRTKYTQPNRRNQGVVRCQKIIQKINPLLCKRLATKVLISSK